MKIIECVPNISEGRNQKTITTIQQSVQGIKGVKLISCESDADHNRSVLTLAGEPEGLLDGAFEIYRLALELIDLRKHQGEHPRMGAVDVCPFIPVQESSMEECVELANKLGERVGKELSVPVYLYESAAQNPERQNLAKIRKGQFEKLRELIGQDQSKVPDYGPNAIHPSFGATAIGARFFLIAYNVNLEGDAVELAQAIGKAIREKNGGLAGVKAMGFEIEIAGKKYAQVSMNLVDYRKTSPAQAYQRIMELAREQNVEVKESELVGVIPQAAMELCAKQLGIEASDNLQVLNQEVAKALKLKDYRPELILENNL